MSTFRELWRDIRRDIQESQMTPEERKRHEAAEAERKGEYWNAAIDYKKLGEFSRAADLFLRVKSSNHYNLSKDTAECLRRAGRVRELQDVLLNILEEYHDGGGHIDDGSDDYGPDLKAAVKLIRDRADLKAFMEHAAEGRRARRASSDLVDCLDRVGETKHAADLAVMCSRNKKGAWHSPSPELCLRRAMELYAAAGDLGRFLETAKDLIEKDPHDWVALRLALEHGWLKELCARLKWNVEEYCPMMTNLADLVSNAIKEGGEARWRPALETYEELLKRIRQEDNEFEKKWSYWNDLPKLWESAGDKERAARLRLESLPKDSWQSSKSKFEQQFKALWANERKGEAHQLAIQALSLLRKEEKEASRGLDLVYRWFTMLGAREQAAEAYELYLRARPDESIEKWGQERLHATWPRAIRLWELAGNKKRAAEIAREIGRLAKATRLEEALDYNLAEINFLRGLSKSGAVTRLLNQLARYHEEPGVLYSSGRIAEAARAAERSYFEGEYSHASYFSSYVCHLGLASMYLEAGDQENAERIFRKAEKEFREVGLWQFVLGMYFDAARLSDVERVAREEDELECAIIAYDAANMPEEAARIYDEIGAKTGSTDKPKTNTKKERTPGSGEDVDQLFCPQCGAEVKPHWTVCPKCDTDLQERKCRNCGEPLQPDWKRCPVCRKTASDGD